MFDTIRKCIAMMPSGMRGRWLTLVPLSLLTSASEAATAAAIYALFQVLNDPAQATVIPWVAWIVRRLPSQDPNAIVLQLMAVAAIYHVCKTAIAILSNYVRYRILHDASAALSTEMLRRYLAAPYPFHFHRNSAELIRNCTTSVGEMMGVVLATTVSASSEALVALALAAVLLATAPGLSVAAGTVLLVLLFIVLRLTRKAASRLGEEMHLEKASMLKTLQQAIGGIKEIKVLGREPYFYDEFGERQRRVHTLGNRGITLGYLPAVVIQTVMVVGGLALVAVIMLAGGPASATLPTVALFGYAALRLMPTATWLLNTITGLRTAARAVDDLYEDFTTLHSPAPQVAEPLAFERTITLDHVSYQYPRTAAPALIDVSLSINKGESIGIVGPTGAGKSTLVDVVLGLLPPAAGRLLVDEVPAGASGTPWRRRVGYVPQTLFLLDDSLRRNIALGIADGQIDDARIRQVMAMAQLTDFVARLPNGLDTPVGERGVRISGGERQRIAIARALYHDPDFLVFDEATASLDLSTEAEVTRTIDELRGRRTMLVIAHRLSTVKTCDRIVFIRAGRVEAVGSFDELRARNKDFRELAALAAF